MQSIVIFIVLYHILYYIVIVVYIYNSILYKYNLHIIRGIIIFFLETNSVLKLSTMFYIYSN